jgi:tetratricopeptide (TPR) repeat protein
MLPKAEACYRVALSEEPDNGEAHFQLAYTLSEMAKQHLANGEMDSARVKFVEATKNYMEAAKIDSVAWADEAELNMSSNFARVFNEGSKLIRNDDPSAALEYYKLAYQIDPEGENGARAQLNIVQLTYQQLTDKYRLAQSSDDKEGEQKAKDEAAELLTRVNKALPNATDSETKRTFVEVKAAILRMLDRDAEARKIYEDLLEENPDDINLMLTLARSQKEQGDDQGAAEFYQRALDQISIAPVINEDGRYDYVYAETARAYFRAAEYQKAIDAFKQALDVAKTDIERIDFYDRISVAYFQLEKYEKAVEFAKQVADLDPENLNAWQIQCRALGRLDRQADAEKACARFYELRDAQDQ